MALMLLVTWSSIWLPKKPATQIPKVCFWETWQNLGVSPENIASQTKIENRTSCLYNLKDHSILQLLIVMQAKIKHKVGQVQFQIRHYNC